MAELGVSYVVRRDKSDGSGFEYLHAEPGKLISESKTWGTFDDCVNLPNVRHAIVIADKVGGDLVRCNFDLTLGKFSVPS